ncbi:MAG: hypothetical protein A2Y33_14445 [Spirochaetes bacterium GWF1_51_8]|nr:MAG: hypothetical protein A2Y33_14445 [Spirochaetes bacterium GWF1_51_8]
MKKLYVSATLAAAILSAGCSVTQMELPQNAAQKIEYVLTGDPAVDASMPFLTPEELVFYGFIGDSGIVPVSVSPSAVVVSAHGPLYDARAVRGKGLSISSYFSGTDSNTVLLLAYGYSPDGLSTRTEMKNSGFGSFTAELSIPQNAGDTLYYKIVDLEGNVAADSKGQPYAVKVYDRIVSFSYSKAYVYGEPADFAGWLTVNYSGPSLSSNTVFHYGWNNWQNVADTNMQFMGSSTYYSSANYSSIMVKIPNNAEYLDFVFFGNGVWDNNGGGDFHMNVKPIVIINPSKAYDGSKYISVVYANGTLSEPVYAHYGVDGWQNVKDEAMYAAYYRGSWLGFYSKTVNVEGYRSQFDLVFHDSANRWENNYGMDWHFDIGY